MNFRVKEDKVSFEARVKAITLVKESSSTPSKRLVLDLKVQETILKARIDAETIGEETWSQVKRLTIESLVRVLGVIHIHGENTKVNGEGHGSINGATKTSYEMDVVELTVIAFASPDLPILTRGSTIQELGLEERLQNRVLDLRNHASGAVFKLHSGMCQLIVEFLCSQGFHWIHTPRIITATISGDNEYFHLPYFGRDAWLAQSTQHHKQMALSMDMERVFEIGPVFRAEVKSKTSARHMTEFTVLDIAMVFQDDYHEVVELIESMLLFVFRGLQERKQYRKIVETVKEVYPSAREFRIGLDEQGKVPRISFLEAKRILRKELGFETDDKKNFTNQEEAALGRHFRACLHLGNTDMFTIDQYPASMRQFNSQANPDSPEFSNTWDTIVGGREICSGSQRINSYEGVCEAMRSGVCGPPLDPDEEKWQPYLTAFKAGMPRHGGCGLGVNRLLQSFLGLDDVREVTLFPRDVNRVTP